MLGQRAVIHGGMGLGDGVLTFRNTHRHCRYTPSERLGNTALLCLPPVVP